MKKKITKWLTIIAAILTAIAGALSYTGCTTIHHSVKTTTYLDSIQKEELHDTSKLIIKFKQIKK